MRLIDLARLEASSRRRTSRRACVVHHAELVLRVRISLFGKRLPKDKKLSGNYLLCKRLPHPPFPPPPRA